jgi:acetyl esterase/lipase
MKHILRLACATLAFGAAWVPAQNTPRVVTLTNLAYYGEQTLAQADEYQRNLCRLDLRYPADRKGFATVVWFHGGGLTGGKRHFIDLGDPGIAVAAVGYRLSPKAAHPAYLEDAAAAVAWTLRNIQQYGGDPAKVFVAGHSAGGYLSALVGMDPRWLAAQGLSIHQLAGLIPVSAQVTTHFHVKKLMGDTGPQYRPIINEYAPLYHCAGNLPPVCLVSGDRKIEFKCRVEENALMAVSLRTLGHPDVEFHELAGLDHGTCVTGAMPYARAFIQKHAAP